MHALLSLPLIRRISGAVSTPRRSSLARRCLGPYPPAITAARKEGLLPRDPLHYVTKHLQQEIESDHFRVKRPMPRIGGFQSFHTARRTIRGFEAMLWLRKGFGFAGAWT